jgi:hypothetical protein
MENDIWSVDHTQRTGSDWQEQSGTSWEDQSENETSLLDLATKNEEEEEEELDENGNPIPKPGMQADGTFVPYTVDPVDPISAVVKKEDKIDLGKETGEKSGGLKDSSEGIENKDLLAAAFGGEGDDKFGMKEMGQELMKGPSYTYQMFGKG